MNSHIRSSSPVRGAIVVYDFDFLPDVTAVHLRLHPIADGLLLPVRKLTCTVLVKLVKSGGWKYQA